MTFLRVKFIVVVMNDDKNQSKTTPLDPTSNAADLMGDPSGMSGISQATPTTPKTSTGSVTDTMSQTAADAANDIATEEDQNTIRPSKQQSDDTTYVQFPSGIRVPQNPKNITTQQAPYNSPEEQGEHSVSGSDPAPESDDDTLANAHAVGEQLEEDPEHPEELDLARDVDNAEQNLAHD